MDPITGTLAGAGVNILAQLIGRALAEGDLERARQLREQALAEYGPDILPQLEDAVAELQGRSEFESIQEDDALRAQQLRALTEMEGIYSSEGMTEADKAALALGQGAVNARAGQDYSNISQMLARRGDAARNTGLQAALYSQSGQDAVNATARMAGEAQQSARGRALRALEAGAGLAGDVRSADYRSASDKAAAQDAINRFNTMQRWTAQEAQRAKEMDAFAARMGVAGARSNIYGDMAADATGSAARTQATAAGIGAGAQSAGEGAAGYWLDRRKPR